MKELPIIFSTAMVLAILDNRKSMTRRAIKNIPDQPGPEWYFDAYDHGPHWNWWHPDNRMSRPQIKCPYGQPGDLLYVREEWYPWLDDKGPDGYTRLIRYAADDFCIPVPKERFEWFEERSEKGWQKRRSFHLPKWVSRIWLEVTNIRVERVTDITEADAKAEGVDPLPMNDDTLSNYLAKYTGCPYKPAFSFLWDEINEARGYGWEEDPWVWVIEFKRIKP